MKTTFNNVSITIEANSPEEAYKLLCAKLFSYDKSVAYSTDTYTTNEDSDNEHSTDRFFRDEFVDSMNTRR